MTEEEELPTFPDILPSSIRETVLHEIEEGDIETNEDLQSLIGLMYDHAEREFYYVRRREGHSAGPLDRALGAGIILEEGAELFWYKHPRLTHNYVHVEVRDGNYAWDWQRDVVENTPMFVRIRLRLAERTRRGLEIKQKIQAEREAESSPVELKPGVFGFSIDLIKGYHWAKKKLRACRSRGK